jgi:hypothetical protein
LISLNYYSFHVANAIWESNISGWNARAGWSITKKLGTTWEKEKTEKADPFVLG